MVSAEQSEPRLRRGRGSRYNGTQPTRAHSAETSAKCEQSCDGKKSEMRAPVEQPTAASGLLSKASGSTVRIGCSNESCRLRDKAADQSARVKSLSDLASRLTKHHLQDCLPDTFYLLHIRKIMPQHTLGLKVWAEKVAKVLVNGLACLVENIGGWILGDLECPLLLRLLHEHPNICRAYREDPSFIANNPPPSYDTTSKILVAPSDSEDVNINDRFSVKLCVRIPQQKVCLLLQALNFRGRTTHLGQFPL